MRDLSDELRELLTERANAAPPPPAPGDTIVRRVRRRAAVRACAAAGGVTIATVAIVAVGAAAVRTDTPGGDGVAGSGVCEPVTHHVPTGPGDAAHLSGRIDYPRTPPNSGPHAPVPAPPGARGAGDGAPTVEQLVHNLEHGYVVVWYEPGAADEAVLDAALEGAPRKVLAAPWPRGPLPAPYVMTAWGHEQRCTMLSRQVVESFYERYGHTNGDAPEGAAL